jgi:endonuclease YncB( thermonuclease family)
MDFGPAHRFRQQFARLTVGAGLGLGVACLAIGVAARAQADCGTPSGSGRVVAVDERLDIALQDGRFVRLAGLEAFNPTRVSPETAGAARQFLSERLLGRKVELKLVASGTDRWGRALADLSLPESSGGAGSSVAMALLSAGYARVRPEFEARDCAAARLAVEDGARRAGLGLWSEPDYAVIQSSDAAALRSWDGQFVVLEGRVRRVGFGRSRLYLDLVRRDDGPTIVVARKLESTLVVRVGRPVEMLAGQTIRARGALDDRIGPRIEVNEPAMIEIVRPLKALGAEKPRR